MTRIRSEHMGDVWPAVGPGQAGDYGTAQLDGPDTCPIRTWQTFRIVYTVGKFGLDDTGAIRISHRFVHDGGRLQADDPAARNHVTAVASNGTPLSILIEPHGYRPWMNAMRINVTGGYLRPGDTITVTIGDRAGGGPGLLMQTIAEAAFQWKVSVDACATGQFVPLDDWLAVAVVAGPVTQWRLVAPGLRRPQEPFALGIRAEDEWGNPAPARAVLGLTVDAPITGLPERVEMDGPALTLENLTAEAGTIRVRLNDDAGRFLTEANPIVIADSPHAGYWGDLHGQSGETIGIGTIDDYMTFARDRAFLDVSGHQGNDFQMTDAFWQKLNRVTGEMTEEGRFVLFPGYEWSANTALGGDHNVFFRHEGRAMRRSSHAMLADRREIGGDANTLTELFEALSGEDCVLWAHVGGRPADVSNAHDPRLKTAVEVHSNWGTFEWILTDSLALGHRVGVVANSDGHKGRPGAGGPGATEFGAYGGLTCFLAPQLTRDALFECMRRRHHYATSGSRLHMDVRARFDGAAGLYERDPALGDRNARPVHEAIMGDIVETAEAEVALDVEIAAGAPILRVDIMNGAEPVATRYPYGPGDLGNRLWVTWQGAAYRGRGRNTHWTGEIAVDGARIGAMTPINYWNHERRLDLVDGRKVMFDAVTSGNFAGVDLRLDSGDARAGVASNRVRGAVEVSALGLDDHVLDAGGLERQIRLRRLPDELTTREMRLRVCVPLTAGRDNPVWIRVSTLDGHLAWSSPIYLLTPPA